MDPEGVSELLNGRLDLYRKYEGLIQAKLVVGQFLIIFAEAQLRGMQ